jgi:hypothetical protein
VTQSTDVTTGSETFITTLGTTSQTETTTNGQGSPTVGQNSTDSLSTTAPGDTTGVQSETTTAGQGSPTAAQTSTDSLSTTAPADTTGVQSETTAAGQAPITASSTTTATLVCQETEYIETLLSTNSISIKPDNTLNKQDLVTNGLDFADTNPSFIINLPEGGLIIRGVTLPSLNILTVQIVFQPELGTNSTTLQGPPTSLPVNEFPTEKIGQIIINVIETLNGTSPSQVTLSVTVCSEPSTTTSSSKHFHEKFSTKR